MTNEEVVNSFMARVTAMDLDSKRETSRRLKISGPSAADVERSKSMLALELAGR